MRHYELEERTIKGLQIFLFIGGICCWTTLPAFNKWSELKTVLDEAASGFEDYFRHNL